MVVWHDVLSITSLGTGTAQTQLNGGSNYTTASQARTLLEITPLLYPGGAMTAGEVATILFSTQSTSIGSIAPKNIILPPIQFGLGTVPAAQIPILRSWRLDTLLPNSNTPISFYGTPLASNTAAYKAGCTLTFTDGPPSQPKEQFYDCVTATTSTGTSAASVALPSITINNGTLLNLAYGHIMASGTVTASQSYSGSVTLSSSDMLQIQREAFQIQPLATALGTAIGLMQPDFKPYSLNIGLRNTATVGATFTLNNALTGAGTVVYGLGFLR